MIRLVIVEDHPAIAEGIGALLDDQDDIELVGGAVDVDEAERVIEATSPDVVLCDIRLAGDRDGFALLAGRTRPPAFVMLSAFSSASHYRQAFEAGAVGFVAKTASLSVIADAVRAAALGKARFPSDARRLADAAPKRPSPRELQVVELVGEGLTNAEVADRLGIRVKTVESQLRRLFDRYDVSSRTRLIRFALQQGWLSDR